MATIVTTSNLSLTLANLQPGTTYYYQITAFNNTTPGSTSLVQSHNTLTGNSSNLILVGGKAYMVSGKGAITDGPEPTYRIVTGSGLITIGANTLTYR